eukprot:COSAG02_NODE_26146_length_639_cov_2.753704_1_plen_153_part_01
MMMHRHSRHARGGVLLLQLPLLDGGIQAGGRNAFLGKTTADHPQSPSYTVVVGVDMALLQVRQAAPSVYQYPQDICEATPVTREDLRAGDDRLVIALSVFILLMLVLIILLVLVLLILLVILLVLILLILLILISASAFAVAHSRSSLLSLCC